MPNILVPQCQIETRSSNKTAHPGDAVKTTKHRTTAEVQEGHVAKAQAKAAHEDARLQSINCTAEFEHADMANEDLVDATPRPPFTPKPWPQPHKQASSDLTPLAETSDVDLSDNFKKASFTPPTSKRSVTTDESAVDSDMPTPVTKKLKVEPKKAMVKTAGKKKAMAKKADKKPRMQDEFNVAAKKIRENESQGNKYASMMKSMSGKQGEEPALKFKAPSQPQATVVGGKKLQGEGAITDFITFAKEITTTEPDQHSKQNNLNDPQ
jgi:hypothetical protein